LENGQGIELEFSQALDRTNKIAVLSNLTRVVSSISGEAELLEQEWLMVLIGVDWI